jgi:putative tryptophan/tyrosine transport system substrate-binding protein
LAVETAARSFKVAPITAPVHSDVEIETAIMDLGSEPGGGLVVTPDSIHDRASGAKPAELPVQLPTKFVMTINAKDAHALGLTIPSSILLRADEIIE